MCINDGDDSSILKKNKIPACLYNHENYNNK